MIIAAQFTNVFYYVTPDNQYFRGPLFAVLLSPLVVIMILNVEGIIGRRNKLTKRYFIGLTVYLLPMTVSLIFHMFLEAEVYVVLCMALFAFVMFGLILADNMDQFMRQQSEIANHRAGIMVLQMRPHFICNTMMSIYYLCDQDVAKAKQVTLDFTTYLRKNFTAIASETPVPFTEELEHTRAYLAVEQAQFEDVLFVLRHAVHDVPRAAADASADRGERRQARNEIEQRSDTYIRRDTKDGRHGRDHRGGRRPGLRSGRRQRTAYRAEQYKTKA